MPARDFNLRLQTREFASAFSTKVSSAADAVGARSKDPLIRSNTIRWKLSATSAVQQSSLRTDPMLALVDTWVLCQQIKEFFAGAGGEQSLGPDKQFALQTATELEEDIASIARTLLPAGDFDRVATFVDEHSPKHPLHSLAFERDSVAMAWLKQEDGAVPKSVGNMSEAITDLSDRVSTLSQQIPIEVRWRIDLERQELEPFAADLKRFSAGAEAAFQSFPMLAENAKLLADNAKQMTKAANDLTLTLAPEIGKFDQQWQATLLTLKTEREAVMEVVRTERIAVVGALEKQRESLTKDFARERAEIAIAADRMAQNAIAQAGQQVRDLVRSVLLYAALLALIVLGLPFLSGYLVGRSIRRKDPGDSGSPAK